MASGCRRAILACLPPAPMPDAWLAFSLDPAADPVYARDADAPALDYGSYLGLDTLLAAGEPRTSVPDERAFIATHQLIEVAFRLMIADLATLAGTLASLTPGLATEPLPGADGPSPFWRPALTAAARLRHTAREILPASMRLLGQSDDGDVLFSTLEFNRFRAALAPSSGFQTAQLRLVQRALGKEAALRLPLYPGDTFSQHYHPDSGTGCPVGHVAPADPLILREAGTARAFPDAADAPEARVAALDTVAHEALAALAPLADGLPEPPAIPHLTTEDADRVVARVRQTLGPLPDADAVMERLAGHVAAAVDAENARRDALAAARRGAQGLAARHRRSCLAFVLDRLAATDAALHGPDPESRKAGEASFLTVHRRTVRRHVADDSGTGGGGMPYLVTSQRFVLPLFPALVAWADLSAAAGADDDPDRW